LLRLAGFGGLLLGLIQRFFFLRGATGQGRGCKCDPQH
jgi:hypothetical protein